MQKQINIKAFIKSSICLLAICAVSCNTTKRLAPDEYLLKKNKIELVDDIHADKDALSETIRPQPNRKLLGVFPLYVWAYNVPNPAKFEKRNEKRLKKLEVKNARRIAKGKEPLELKPFGSWWRETVGEAPVVFDSSAVKRSEQQLTTYLIKHGWFNAQVEAQPTFNDDSQTAKVLYKIKGGKPYKINSLSFDIPDVALAQYTMESRRTRSNLQPGDQFNIDKLDTEREKLNNYFKNLGYFNFNKELIYFDVDSSLNAHAVDLTLGIVPRKVPYSGDPDSLLTAPYKKYKIKSVTIIDRPVKRTDRVAEIDTLLVKNYQIIDQHQLHVKPRILTQNVIFKPDDYYQLDKVTRTYRRLSALPIVRATNVQFVPVSDDIDNNELNSNIIITPSAKQNVSFEWRGTNRGGFLGISGSVGYQNKNIFGGAEKFNFSISGGAEAQQLLTQSQNDGNIDGDVRDNLNLNTIEFGPEVSLTFPKFLLPIKAERFAKSADPKTQLTANLSYQKRPDYERTRSFGSIAYKWSESDQKKWVISPLEISLIKINRSDAFDAQLQAIGDAFLTNSFRDHFILDTRVAYTFNTQNPNSKEKNFYFYHGEIESAGSILRGLFDISEASSNESGNYEVLGIQFAQYLKTIQDARYYRNINEKMSMAYRLTGGIGVPLENLNVLPFEKSFFGGGANDIRAWQARTLGPGSYSDPRRSFDKIGDILLEANAEYRFVLINILEGALFADAGNIWTINADPARPGANFEADRFLSEIGVGVGAGLRLNFDFFLIRADLGLQLKDPALPIGERWLFQPKDDYNELIEDYNQANPELNQIAPYNWRWNLNIGIGYPF